MRSTTWDTARARALKDEGVSATEIADMVGVSVAAIRSYFSRVDADDRRLQRSLEAAQSEVETTRCTAEPQPLAARAKRNSVAKKVAALLAESEATLPEVERILEQVKYYLVVSLKHSERQDMVYSQKDDLDGVRDLITEISQEFSG